MSCTRRQSLSVVTSVALVATLLLASCLDDPSGPGIRPGFLALSPSFPSSAAGIVDVASVHVQLTRNRDGTLTLDTTVAINSESETVDLSFSVMVSSSSETFTLDLECLSPSGEVVFRAEGLTVTATPGGGDNVVAQDVPIAYVGVGSNAASVTILNAEQTVRFGDTLQLLAEVLDSSGAVIEGTPIKWISHDTTRVVVPDPRYGRVVGNRVRDWVHVEALLLTGPADTADVIVEPVPSSVTVTSGDAQSGTVNAQLTNPVVVQVDAVDGPIPGVPVEFATAGDGYFGLSSVLTDASGQASTTWTLGSAIGTQTATASVGSLVATITATANTPYDPALSFTVQPSDAVYATTITPAIEVTALDGFGLVDETFSGAVAIVIGNNPSGGTLSGTATVNAAGGIATFGDLSIDLPGGGYSLLATAAGYEQGVSQGFDIIDLPPQQIYWSNANGGDWNTAGNWSTGTVPTALDTAVISLDGTYTVTLGSDVTVAAFSLGGLSGTQTLLFNHFNLTTNGASSVGENGIVDTGSGILAGAGSFTNSGSVVMDAGTLDLPVENSGLILASASINTISGALTTTPSSVLRVSGILNYHASLTITNGFTNAGVIDISQGTSYSGYNNTFAVTNGTLINTGTIQATAGARSGTRTLEANVDNQGTIHLVDHDLVFGGAYTYATDAGTLTIPDGRTLTLDVNATLILGTGTTLTPTASGRIVVDGNITLASDFTLGSGEPTLNLFNNNSVVTTISGTGAFTNADTVMIREDVIDVPFTNQGVLLAYDAFDGSFFNRAFSNETGGVFRMPVTNTGGVTFASGFTNAGLIEISQGSSYTSYTATLTVATGTLTNTGTIESTAGVRNGERVLDADVDNQGTIALTTHDLIVPSPRTLTTAAGTLTIPDGRVLTLRNGTTTILGTNTTLTATASGRVLVQGDLTIASDFTLASGEPAFDLDNTTGNVTTISGAGSFTNADTVFIRMDVIDVPFYNEGVLLAYEFDAGSVFNNAFSNTATGVFRIPVYNNSGVEVVDGFTNAGIIDLSQGTAYTGYTSTLTVSNGTLTNTGTIMATLGSRAGTRVLVADVENQGIVSAFSNPLTLNAPGFFTNTSTGTLEGASTIDLSGVTEFTNLGAVSPGRGGNTSGVLTVSNSLAFDDPGSSLNIDLNGLTLGSQYDQLAVSGPVTLSGALNVAVDAGFAPVEGNTFRVLTATSIGGGFSDMFFSGIGAGFDLDPVWSATALDLVVVAIPPGTNAIWEGASSTNWNDAANWSTGTVPTDIENVWIRQAPINQPVVGTSASVGSVAVQSGATVTVNGGAVLSVFGDLDATGSIVGTGSVAMMTSGTTLAGTVNTIDIRNDVTLAGPVTVGSVDVNAGQLVLGGNTMNVAFGFTTAGSGILVMTDPADVLNTRDALFGGGATDTYLTAGTLTVTESFAQRSDNTANSFVASGTHRTVFNGPGAQQQITFTDYGPTASRFQELEAEGSAVVALPGFIGNGAYVAGNLTIRGSADFSPGCDRIDIAGDLVTSESGTITMTCDDFANIVVNGNAEFGGGSTVDRLTAGQLTVAGDFTQAGTPQSFAATGLHVTLLSSTGGQQTVTFANPDTLAGSHFAYLTIMPSGSSGQHTTIGSITYATSSIVLDDNNGDGATTVDGIGEMIASGAITSNTGGAGIILNLPAVRLGGALNLTAGVTYDAGVTQFFGTAPQTIPMRTDYIGVLVTGDSVNFDGVGLATIGGDLYITGNGLLDLDSAAVTVFGGLFTQDQGRLRMDVTGLGGLDVAGNASFAGGSTDGMLTGGTFAIGGSFEQLSTNSATSFAASRNHTTLLNGSVAQTVVFATPGAALSRFGNLTIENDVSLVGAAAVINNAAVSGVGQLTLGGNALTVANTFSTTGSGTLVMTNAADRLNATDASFNGESTAGLLTAGTIELTGDLSRSTGSLASFSASGTHTVVMNGTTTQFITGIYPGATESHLQNLHVTGSAILACPSTTFSMLGWVLIDGTAALQMDGGYVEVGGDFTTAESGTLTMVMGEGAPDLYVTGNATFGGGSTSGLLNSGALWVAGNFAQLSTNSTQSFAPLDGHVTVLNGTGQQIVQFDDPDPSLSHFDDLRIDNTTSEGIVLNSDVYVYSDFLTPTDATTRYMFGQGYSLRGYSIDIQNMVLNNMPLDVQYNSGYSQFIDIDDVTFQSMDPTVTQLSIVRDFEWGTFTNLTFSTVPTTGYYAHFDDPVDSGNNAVFTMVNPNPAYHSGFALVTGFAFLSGWPDVP